MKIYLYAIILLTTALAAQQLVVNPDFSELDINGKPVGWKCDKAVRIIPDVDGMNKAVILDARNAGLSQDLELKPEYAHLELDFWMKTTNVVQGEEGWHTARLAMSFHDANGKQVGDWPRVFGWCGTSEWCHCVRRYIIPKGATRLSFNAVLFAVSGMVEFKNIRFTVTANRLEKPANAPCPISEEEAQSIENAWFRMTPTRETISLNGLWQFRPALMETTAADENETSAKKKDTVPADDDCWGWFKLPAIWPDRWDNDEAYQSPILAQYFEDNILTKDNAVPEKAWYKRTINIPPHWEGRQIVMEFSLVNTHAKVFVDNVQAGELWFPGGEVDLTGKLLPGKRHSIAILVEAIPLSESLNAFMAPDRIVKENAVVKNKGINGDVYLTARPKGQRIVFVQAIPSVSQNTITFRTELEDAANIPYKVVAEVTLPDGSVKTFSPKLPSVPDERNSIVLTFPWKNAPLWEPDDPQLLTTSVSLYSASGETLIDRTIPFTFGFREFEARGKDLYLNGIPIHLRALHCEAGTSINVECSAEPEATEMLHRMRQYGFNFLINAHYNFNYGAMNYLEGLLVAAEKNGFLMSFSLPHLNQFGWKLHETSVQNRFTWMTRFLIRKVANNPAVVMYAMNHNSCGYYGDQNPLKIDGKYHREEDIESEYPLPGNRRNQAMHAEKIVKYLDPTRLVYHHESGNLGDFHSVNIYLNWAPLQERSDWMKHWAENGVKPVFFVEWGLPHISSWSSYRGPEFIWRTKAFQSLWATEYAAAEIGEEAYRQASDFGVDPIVHEQKLWEQNKPFAWSELNQPIAKYPFYHQIMAKYATDNWRSHRAFGVSAMLPWDQGALWNAPDVVQPKTYQNDLGGIKQPGLFPDRLNATPKQYIYGKTDPKGWTPSPLGEAFLRWNQDTCAFIGGANEEENTTQTEVITEEDETVPVVRSDNQQHQHFVSRKKRVSQSKSRLFTPVTDKSHSYRQGETIQKTIVLINDTRQTRVATVDWRCQSIRKSFKTKIKPGTVAICPISCVVGDSGLQNHTFGSRIMMTAKFDNGDVWTDQFDFQTLPIQDKLLEGFSAWIYDPKGMTTKYMQEISMLTLKPLEADTVIDFTQPQDPIIIGREALDDPTAITWLPEAISKGKVLIFEQSYDALTKRLGFRANIHGLRELFVTKYIHPAFRDCVSPMDEDEEQAANTALKNWRGASTMTPPYLDVPEQETHNPKWNWLGFENTRVWTAGNQGTVASILIEKPEIGNWRPLAVGGFDLQYTALMELIVNKGRTIFCQLDVTNRTENDPVADRIACRLIHYLIYAPTPGIKRKVYYAGGPEGRELLVKLKVNFEDHKPFTEDLNVDSDDYKANLTKKLEHPSLLNDILFLAHGAPRKILEQTNMNAQEPKNILEKLDRAEKVPAGLVAVGLDLKELALAGVPSDFKADFDIRNYEKIIDYLERKEFKEEVEELKLLIEQGVTSDIDQALLHIKEKLELARLDFDPVPELNYNKLKNLITYLERIGFKNEAKELARVEAEGIPNILEETLHRIELKTKQAGLDKGSSLAIAFPLPEENHLEKKAAQKRNKQALKDYIKNKPDTDIAETAFEMIRGMTSADIYWHAKLAKTAVALTPKNEIDKYVISIPSLYTLLHERRATICLQVGPWDFDYVAKPYLRTSYRRSVFAIAKLLANLGADFNNPILEIVANPPQENAWLNSYYLQEPQAEDDPYRYYRW